MSDGPTGDSDPSADRSSSDAPDETPDEEASDTAPTDLAGTDTAPIDLDHPVSPDTNGLAVASLVLGILGLLTFWTCGIGALLGLVAVGVGVLGLRSAKARPGEPHRSVAIGGIVTGALAVVVGVGFVVAVVVLDDADRMDPYDGVCNSRRFVQDPDC